MDKQFKDGIATGKVLRFTLPTISMMIFLALYTTVDGLFVSNLVGENALAALNIAYPAISVIIGIGIMLGMGSSAIIAKNIGEDRQEDARRRFAMMTLFGVIIGIIIVPTGILLSRKIASALGATEALFEDTVDYLRIMFAFSPFMILQLLFQSFFVTAGKPKLGLVAIVASGITNVILDYVFIGILKMGVSGAALGTSLAYMIPSITGLIYFSKRRDSSLYFIKPKWESKIALRASLNGSSEMVSNLAMAVTTFLFNIAMLEFYSEDGVAAITIAQYLQFLLSSAYIGYSMGVLPVISYSYGRKDEKALKDLFKISVGFIAVNSAVWFIFSIIMRSALINIFVDSSSKVYEIAIDGWIYFAVSFLFCGFNIFASALFTAFSDGKTSAFISTLRTFVILSISIILLPKLFGSTGIWVSVSVAEGLTLIVAAFFVIVNNKKYRYL